MEENTVNKRGIRAIFTLEKLPLLGVFILLTCVSFFFIPSAFITFQFSKVALVFFTVIISFCLYIVYLLKRGQFELPTSYIYIALASIPLIALIASIFSSSSARSFMGYGFEVGTFSFLFIVSICTFLVSLLFRSEKRLVYAFGAILFSVIIVSLFHLVRFLFGPNFLSFGMFTTQDATPVGGWYDLAILYGSTLIISLMTIELLPISKVLKMFMYGIFVLAICFLVITNFSLLWIVLACLSLVFFVYFFSIEGVSNYEKKIETSPNGEVVHIAKGRNNTRKVSIRSLVVLVISIMFLLPLGSVFSNSISSMLGASNIQVRPSWTATFNISKNVLKENPAFGIGPNNFSTAWQQFKPIDINTTQFWNLDFISGIGFVPTFLVTTGIFGILSWLVFLALFVYVGFISLFTREQRSIVRYASTTSFFVSLYFWIMCIFYVPSTAIIVLTFFMTGLFFATAHMQGVLKSKTFAFASFPKASFVFVLAFVLICIVSLAFLYGFSQKMVSAYFFERGASTLRAGGNLDFAEKNIGQAITYGANDAFYREYSALQINRLGVIVSSVTTGEVTEAVQQEFQRILGNAIVSAQKAIEFNNTNYENWVALGRVYESVMPLGLDQAYENAKNAYEEASKRSSANPQIYFILARLEATKQDFVKAKEYIAQALSKKSNYSEAIFLKSKIEVSQGDIKSAIASVENISVISPNDVGVFFELGLLKYNYKDYVGAVKSFERAISLLPEYSNAKYFLGLSYEKINKRQLAVKQMEEILALNPGNPEVMLILENLNAGRAPFVNAEPPVDDKPEKRADLPIEEKKK